MVIVLPVSARHDCCIHGAHDGAAAATAPEHTPARGSAKSPAPRYAPPMFQQAQFDAPAVRRANVFGEIDGMPCATADPSAEAGFQQHTFVDDGYDADVAVSPDGKWMAFSSTRHNERGDVYLQRVDGLSVTQLTSDADDDATPVFSPDGRRIAFASTRAGTWDIYLMDADGKNVVQVTSGPTQDMRPSFAPDGKRLVYCSNGTRSGQWELWTVDLESGAKRMIGFGLFPSWSPDTSHDVIAFQRARARGSRWFSLWTLELVDGEARHVTEVTVSTNAAVVSPTWSPDGRKLAFSTIVDPARPATGKPAGQQDIWTIGRDGGDRRRLTDGHGTHASPCWAADGRVYFISDRTGTECVWSTSATSGKQDQQMNAATEAPEQNREAVGSAE